MTSYRDSFTLPYNTIQYETPLQEGRCSLIVAGPTQSRFTNLSEGNYKQKLKQINLSNAFLWHNLGNDSSFLRNNYNIF
jgi:hypothetical protein